MRLRDTTKQMIALLEQRSGYLVHVREDPNLPTISTIIIARGNLPAHIISYKPGLKNEPPDYSIIFQCAMSIRMFECPPDDRKLISSSQEGYKALHAILTKPNGMAGNFHLSGPSLDGFIDQLLMGLITHLRSIPLSLRVSEYLSVDHPELLELEVKQAEREIQINKESLADRIRESIPPEIFNPTQCINSAFALFWSERLERPEIANPFRLAGFESQGKELLKIFADIPGDPINDYELIDRWADYLQIRSWFKWTPYESP